MYDVGKNEGRGEGRPTGINLAAKDESCLPDSGLDDRAVLGVVVDGKVFAAFDIVA